MKSTVAVSFLVTIALQQLVLAEDTVNVATVPAVPTLPAPVTDIYWWKTLLTGNEISNYLTGPATEAVTATADAATAGTTTAAASDATNTDVSASPTASATDSAVTLSAVSGSSSFIPDASSAISDISSSSVVVSNSIATPSGAATTPSVVAWSSSSVYAPAPTVVAGKSSSVILPRPSGSIIPPSTTSAGPASSGAMVIADVSKILFSATIAAVLKNLL